MRETKSSDRRVELLLVCAAAALLFAIASTFHAFERLADFAHNHTTWNLDEVAAALILLPAALVFLLLRRHQTEEALRESEAAFRGAIEHAPIGMALVGLTGRWLLVNDSLCRLVGYTREELLLTDFQTLTHPDDLEAHLALAERLRAGEIESYQLEKRYRHKLGSEVWVQLNVSAVRDTQGRLLYFISQIQDIAERRRADAERQVISEIRQGVISTTNLGELFTLIHRALGHLVSAGNCFVALHNPETDLLHFEFFVDQHDHAPPPIKPGRGLTGYMLRAGRPLLLTAGEQLQLAARGEVEIGGTVSASWLGVPLRTPSGTIGALVMQHYEDEHAYSARDVEFLESVASQIGLAIERKLAEDALALANRRAITEYERLLGRVGQLEQTLGTARDLATIFRATRNFAAATVPCGGFVIALYDPVLDARTPVYAWCDGEEIDVTGAAPIPITQTGPNSRAVRTGQAVVTDDVTRFYRGPVIGPNSARGPQSSLVVPMAVMGRIAGTVEAQSYDLTAYRSEHVTAMHMAANLTAVALENLKIEDDLRRARDAALESSRMKSQFLANMSHEIRTPMNGVIGMTELLLDTPLEDGQRRFAEAILTSAGSLLTIINDILDFSKIEAGKLHFERRDFDLAATVEGVTELLAGRARAKGLHLSAHVNADVPVSLRGDAGRLRQVLVNLVGNAVKFTERGEVVVLVERESETETHAALRFHVRDTGIGIAETARARLFQPFVQADGSTTRRYGGTGLGLAISKQLIEIMGGQVGIESEEGNGSVFWFTARFEKQRARTDADADADAHAGSGAHVDEGDAHQTSTCDVGAAGSPSASPASASSASASSFSGSALSASPSSGVRVLVADDNPINLQVALGQLRALGYAADAVANGREAVAALDARAYELVLMDCQMPELDGYEATAEIRRRESGGARRTRVVAMTANAMSGEREKCLAAGMDDYVSKPMGLEDLRAVLARRGLGVEHAPAAPAVVTREPERRRAPVLDRAALASLASLQPAGEPDLVTRVVKLFLADAPSRLDALAAAAGRGDAQTVGREAHRFKSGCLNAGARELAELCAGLETNAAEGRDARASVLLVAELWPAFERLRRELERELEVVAV